MSQPVAPLRCIHKLNPRACLQCFHQASRAHRAAPPPRPVFGQPMAPVAPPEIQRVIDRGFGNGTVVEGRVPPPQGPQAIPPRERPPQRREPPRDDGAAPQVAKEPFSYQNQAWATDENGLERPPERRSLIDAAPQHPHLDQTRSH